MKSRGQHAHYGGLAAEDIVARDYAARGYEVLEHRWRGQGGEIDLIVQNADTAAFVEVKRSKNFARAATHLSPAQTRRLFAAASEYVGHLPTGQLTPMRFDVALVDQAGQIQIIENALGY